jgi:hypothetical protein
LLFDYFQENLQKLIELQRDMIGIDTVVHPDRVCYSLRPNYCFLQSLVQ